MIETMVHYFPEPNTIVKLVGNKLECSFGVGSSEGATLMKKLIHQRKLEPGEMAFDSKAAIATDGGRFYAKLDKNTPATGQVLMYTSQNSTGQEGIEQAQFRALFYAAQQSATAEAMTKSFVNNPRYFSVGCPNAAKSKFREEFQKLYPAIFPHTRILGPNLDQPQHWLNFANELKSLKEDIKGQGNENLRTAFEMAKMPSDELSVDQKLELVNDVLIESISDITAYLKRLFKDTNPI